MTRRIMEAVAALLIAVAVPAALSHYEKAQAHSLTENSPNEMASGRSRLAALAKAGARDRHPALLGLAEDRFDCWRVDQEESPSTGRTVDCRAEFLDAVARLEGLESGAGSELATR